MPSMKSEPHTCPADVAAAVMDELGIHEGGGDGGGAADDMSESVDELREKLANMKRLMEERKGMTLGEISARKQQRKYNSDIIDGNFLSWIFGTALAVILSVSFYAFYNLYNAVLKKFPSKHTEL